MDPFRGRAPRDLEAVLQFRARAPIPCRLMGFNFRPTASSVDYPSQEECGMRYPALPDTASRRTPISEPVDCRVFVMSRNLKQTVSSHPCERSQRDYGVIPRQAGFASSWCSRGESSATASRRKSHENVHHGPPVVATGSSLGNAPLGRPMHLTGYEQTHWNR